MGKEKLVVGAVVVGGIVAGGLLIVDGIKKSLVRGNKLVKKDSKAVLEVENFLKEVDEALNPDPAKIMKDAIDRAIDVIDLDEMVGDDEEEIEISFDMYDKTMDENFKLVAVVTKGEIRNIRKGIKINKPMEFKDSREVEINKPLEVEIGEILIEKPLSVKRTQNEDIMRPARYPNRRRSDIKSEIKLEIVREDDKDEE